MSDFPSVAELLPHAGGMRLLERVVAHGAGLTICETRSQRSLLFRRADGTLPAWVAIEWMAQCAGVHGALAARAEGKRIEIGFLVGGRSARFAAAQLPEGALRVRAALQRATGGLHAFACRVETAEGTLLAEASLGVFIPRDAVVPAGTPARVGGGAPEP